MPVNRCIDNVRSENKQMIRMESEDTREARGYERPKTTKIGATKLNRVTRYHYLPSSDSE